MVKKSVTIFWFRRDLRLYDNAGLWSALQHHDNVLPLFIFDADILHALDDRRDARINFIRKAIAHLRDELAQKGSSIMIEYGKPIDVFKKLLEAYQLEAVYANHDYEPYSRARDSEIEKFFKLQGIPFHSLKDQVIFEKSDVIKSDGSPYTVYTPYKNKWKGLLRTEHLQPFIIDREWENLLKIAPLPIPELKDLGFIATEIDFPSSDISESVIRSYHKTRDFPAIANGTTRLGLHLRFGTISIRELVRKALEYNDTFLNELIWREFFMMILWHHPQVVTQSFKKAYHHIRWLNDPDEFNKWCQGATGFPLVDAGMRQLNTIGYMHNRVRMITANFVTKLLLIDWRWGEKYFAKKLLDYELAANNGNWQWAAGTGCDAQPYFRIFNPLTQIEKFDPSMEYIRFWVPEYGTSQYPEPMVNYDYARKRALAIYKQALAEAKSAGG